METRRVHHDVHTSQLTPHLQRSTQHNSPRNRRFQKVEIRFSTLRTLERDLFLDFGEFQLDEFVVFVSSTVEVGEDLESIFLTIRQEKKYTMRKTSQKERLVTYNPLSTNHLGDSGKNIIPRIKMMAGIICKPHGIRNEAFELRVEVPNWM
jgi:hypothetical protein